MTEMIFWGVTASPYFLKMRSLADQLGLPQRIWPDQASRLQAVTAALRIQRGKHTASIRRYPQMNEGMDEYPAVPFYSFDGRQFFYDSSSLAYHLDTELKPTQPLVPSEPGLRFICQLIDEAFDEFGLYMVHHNRWVTSAASNTMGELTAHEMRKVLFPGTGKLLARRLPQRQVKRCPYLFSVAPGGFDSTAARGLTPPAREGFPPTQALLDHCWRRYLGAMENRLQQHPYLLGERFTLADAAAYGQLGMNLIDGEANRLLQELAPTTHQWLCHIRDGRHQHSRGPLALDQTLAPLLSVIADTFIPLMQQNTAAYTRAISEGQTEFNETAFDKGEALYDGQLLGHPYRSVVKSFQVLVWQDLCEAWRALQESTQADLVSRFPALTPAMFENQDPTTSSAHISAGLAAGIPSENVLS